MVLGRYWMDYLRATNLRCEGSKQLKARLRPQQLRPKKLPH